MRKKTMILGTSSVIVLLIIGSLTNVIGYQSPRSTNPPDSPLFTIRIQTITQQPQKAIHSQFLGMGKENLLPIPTNKRVEQLKEILQIIQRMDNPTYEQFTKQCIQKIQQTSALKDTPITQIIQTLNALKTKPDEPVRSDITRVPLDIMTLKPWTPLCILLYVISYVFFILLKLFTDYTIDCDPTYHYNMNCLNQQIKI